MFHSFSCLSFTGTFHTLQTHWISCSFQRYLGLLIGLEYVFNVTECRLSPSISWMCTWWRMFHCLDGTLKLLVKCSALWPYLVLPATSAILNIIMLLFMVPVKWGNISGSILLPRLSPFWHSFPSHVGFDNSSAIDFFISKSSLHWGINKIIHITYVCMLLKRSIFKMNKVIFEAV